MDIALKPYDPSMLDDMIPAVAQESIIRDPVDSPIWRNLLSETLVYPNRIIRAIYDSAGTFLGYCEIHDTNAEEWELGITILQEHWRKGIGIASMSAFMDEIAETYGRCDFIARISSENAPSVRMFQKLGARPRSVEVGMGPINEGYAKRYLDDHPEIIGGFEREMAELFGVDAEELVNGVLVFDVRAGDALPDDGRVDEGQYAQHVDERGKVDKSKLKRDMFFSSVIDELTTIRDLGTSEAARDALNSMIEKYRDEL